MSKSKFAPEFAGKRFQSIWGALLWRGVVYGIPVGLFVGTFVGIAVEAIGRPHLAGLVGAMLATVICVPVSLTIRNVVLKKRYPSTNTRLVPQDLAA